MIVGTIHSTKGMEFRTCHIVSAECIKKFATQKKMAFTAATRAKTSLNIYNHEALPGYLEMGLLNVQPIHLEPTIESLFPNKSE